MSRTGINWGAEFPRFITRPDQCRKADFVGFGDAGGQEVSMHPPLSMSSSRLEGR
jgi:hypothetical protein